MDMMTTTAAWQRPNQTGSGVPAEDRAAALRARRDCRLAALLPEGAQVWLMDERFDADREIWIVDVLRADIRYGWRLQRYQYDTATDNVYFWGERPVPVVEVRALPLHTLPRFHPIASAAREGMDEHHEVNGAGRLTLRGDQLTFVLMYHQGDDFTFECKRRE